MQLKHYDHEVVCDTFELCIRKCGLINFKSVLWIR
jgi:hypothetical protein